MEVADCTQKKILIIEDDLDIQEYLCFILVKSGYLSHCASDGREGLKLFQATRPDLIMLDIKMDGMDGWETCQRIREISYVPIIMLTAHLQMNWLIRGLEAGADDFLFKPFDPRILIARIKAALRRGLTAQILEMDAQYRDDYLMVDLIEKNVYTHGNKVSLSRTEFRLLEYFFHNSGRLLTSTQILTNVWGERYLDAIDKNIVYSYIGRLRYKLEPDPKNPRYLLNEHGIGYRFVPQVE